MDLSFLLDDMEGLPEFHALLEPLSDYGTAAAITEAEAIAGIVWGAPLEAPCG